MTRSEPTAADVAAAIARLRQPATIRERSARIADAVVAGRSPWFEIRPERIGPIAADVAALTRERFPDLHVPGHSRWRHFEAGGIDRHGPLRVALGERHGQDPAATARALIDLAVVSVLLDAGAGAAWRYREPSTGLVLGRSEGLAIASLDAFRAGLFSADAGDPWRVDAAALVAIDAARLGKAFQVGRENPLVGLEERAALLQALGKALAAQPDRFGTAPRPGGVYDSLRRAPVGGQAVTATALLDAVLDGLSPIWPHGARIAGQPLGDCWPHPALRSTPDPRGSEAPDVGLVPFHKLSQWLVYSLLEPFAWAGLPIAGTEVLTGLPEYRNGGLLIDGGLLVPRPALLAAGPLTVDAEPVIEWRALTVAGLDWVADAVRPVLAAGPGGDRAATLPLAAILEGGTWACGRRMATRLRDGLPPLPIVTDGTVF